MSGGKDGGGGEGEGGGGDGGGEGGGVGGGEDRGADRGAGASTKVLSKLHARMLPLRRASFNVALHAARSVRRGIFIMRCVELMSARALHAGNARAHGDTV